MIEKKEPFLKKSISVGEVLSIAIAMLSAAIMFSTSVQVRLNSLEIRMTSVEQDKGEEKGARERIESKIDGIKSELTDIRIQVTQKKDK